jgi:hypothetical protein
MMLVSLHLTCVELFNGPQANRCCVGEVCPLLRHGVFDPRPGQCSVDMIDDPLIILRT